MLAAVLVVTSAVHGDRRRAATLVPTVLAENSSDPYGVSGCAVEGTIFAMVATNEHYFGGITRFAESAHLQNVPCVVASVPWQLSVEHPYVRVLKLPLASVWQPEPQFCNNHTSGWRHVHVLKTQMISYLLSQGYDVVTTDADWSVTEATFSAVDELRKLPWDVVGTPDPVVDDAQLLNIGLLWLRNTNRTRVLAERVANRSFAAWDQAIFNQEVEADSSIGCCASESVLKAAFHRTEEISTFVQLSFDPITDEDKLNPVSQDNCNAERPPLDAMPPPNDHSLATMYPLATWQRRAFNDIAKRETSRCVLTPCDSEWLRQRNSRTLGIFGEIFPQDSPAGRSAKGRVRDSAWLVGTLLLSSTISVLLSLALVPGEAEQRT